MNSCALRALSLYAIVKPQSFLKAITVIYLCYITKQKRPQTPLSKEVIYFFL